MPHATCACSRQCVCVCVCVYLQMYICTGGTHAARELRVFAPGAFGVHCCTHFRRQVSRTEV